jgi:hypothetical protein
MEFSLIGLAGHYFSSRVIEGWVEANLSPQEDHTTRKPLLQNETMIRDRNLE